MAITKAIIPVAGWGSRRLPITKAIEKCMLPVGNRPIIDYVVQDCIDAGITDIYVVVSEGSTQVQSYYSRNQKLEEAIIANNKPELLEVVRPPEGINFHYLTQDTMKKYGTAIPVALAATKIPHNESVLVLMGDDFIYNADGSSEAARLIEAAGEESALLGVNIDREKVSSYGVLAIGEASELLRIVEKPTIEAAPSTLINVSKYVLTPELLKKIVEYTNTEVEGEYQITDPITEYVKGGGRVVVAEARGQFLDGGSVEGWLHANEVVVKG